LNRKVSTVPFIVAFVPAVIAAFSGAAHAQSSITLYGVVDAGISYVNNSSPTTGHASLLKYEDGIASGTRWGLRGGEDLGGGLNAVFVLENGFNTNTGRASQGGALFGRQAYVGLKQNGFGTLSFGRQYSFSSDYLGGKYSTAHQTVANNYAYHINDVDQLASSRINNSIKFSSDNFGGFTFGALYGFSNQAGAFGGEPATTIAGKTVAGSSSAYSVGLNYANGPLGIGAAYTNIGYPSQSTPAFPTTIANVSMGVVRKLRTVGIGTHYTAHKTTLWALYTNTLFQPLSGASSTFAVYEAGAKYAFTPAWTLAGGYTWMDLSGAMQGTWHQFNVGLDYALSKRTDLYALSIYQRALGRNGSQDVQAQIGLNGGYFGKVGTASNPLAFRVGMRHRF
jgi:predicted porin